ncbi:MAG: inactive transglutaminase family protein [Desulfuromonadales bacterium]|nr:inactive transglutaminase family protein [Desulfuromonadales bacterium]
MKARAQLYILVTVLLCIGMGVTLYKYKVLGFTLMPGNTETVWQVQARIQFDAEDGPVKVSMTLPATDSSRKALFREDLADDYKDSIIEEDSVRKAIWTRNDAKGAQTIYLRGDFYQHGPTKEPAAPPETPPVVEIEEARKLAGKEILQKAHETADSNLALALKVLAMMDDERENPSVRLLLEEVKYRREYMAQVAQVLALGGIHSKVVRGLRLEGKYTQKSITTFIQVFTGERWALLDSDALNEIPFTQVLMWPDDTRSLLDVYGGSNSRIDLSVSSVQQSAGQLAIASGQQTQHALVDFSIYSLPIRDQNTFKLLLLIPLGALVVVILRNLVGIRTSGTFMPILIALAFMQTTLLLGLLLFLVVVGVGLIMRSYLSHLNLLLVPRIASVLVFVIIIFAAVGIISHKLGWHSGLAITLFPMIILSWTIERMSILWEEEGPKEVLVQGGGSLLTASLAYLVMINPNLEHLVFNFPELLLVLLAIIIMIGSYSGFRLLELARFEPMVRDDES